MKYDVIIIGAGVCGCAIARELSRYQLRIGVLEKEEDVCCGTSKANSGIVHAGFDAPEGSLMARLNVDGNERMAALAEELDFPFERNGSLVLCFDEKKRPELLRLYERGMKNGVKELRILEAEEVRALEPNVSGEVVAALYAPTGGIVCPFGLTIALAENAFCNGVEFHFDKKVTNLERQESGWEITAGGEIFTAAWIVNASGVYADVLHNMVSGKKLHITPRRGEYCLLDKGTQGFVRHTVFQLPDEFGKGVLVTPTVHGNTLVGPTAEDIEEREGTNTTQEGLAQLRERASRSVKVLPMNQVITSFAGLRAQEEGDDFIIKEAEDAPGFIDCAGIKSPGLSSAPAIGVMVADILAERLSPEKKKDFVSRRKGILNPQELPEDARAKLIREEPAYGNIICRCEKISEGEIIDAIKRPLGAKSLDGIKRRTRAGMGRCQSGFCAPRAMEILSWELGLPMEEITKSGGASRIIPEKEEAVAADANGQTMTVDRQASSEPVTADDSALPAYDVVVVGGGPAGLAAALEAQKNGAGHVLVLERDKELGGILNQCIHNGFGLHTFQEELTGPEYAARFVAQVKEAGIPCLLNTMVLDISPQKIVTAMSREKGLFQIQAKAVILAMGCRERARGALNIPGYRPAGIFSAGTAQRLVNMEGYLPGREVVILGSGDIGLIMARRMTLEGAKVKVVAELLPYSGGLKRNIVQCLDDYGIPLKLSHTVVDIQGKERVESITLAQVDENRRPIPGTEETYTCDTLLLSCGLIPENELSRELGVDLSPVTSGPIVNESLETSIPGVFACGNVLHVHDLVDFVSQEAASAGRHAAEYVKADTDDLTATVIPIETRGGVRYTVPSFIRPSHMKEQQVIRFRVGDVYKDHYISLYLNETRLLHRKRPVMAPGEMEEVQLKKEQLPDCSEGAKLIVTLEEA